MKYHIRILFLHLSHCGLSPCIHRCSRIRPGSPGPCWVSRPLPGFAGWNTPHSRDIAGRFHSHMIWAQFPSHMTDLWCHRTSERRSISIRILHIVRILQVDSVHTWYWHCFLPIRQILDVTECLRGGLVFYSTPSMFGNSISGHF